MLAMIQTMWRAERGTGAVVIVVDGIWNSRMTGNVGSFRSSTTVLIALDKDRGERGMALTLTVEMAVLLGPELAIHSAALEQDAVRRDIHHLCGRNTAASPSLAGYAVDTTVGGSGDGFQPWSAEVAVNQRCGRSTDGPGSR